MNRKGQISGFSDLQWAFLLVFILFIFVVVTQLQASSHAEDALQDVGWEAQWLATSLAQHPVGDQTVLEALRDPARDEELDALARRALKDTITGKPTNTWFVLVRGQERITCIYRDTSGQETETKECTEATTRGRREQFGRSDAALKRTIFTTTADPQQQLTQAREAGHPAAIVTGPGNVYVGVYSS